jgi:hypothetical protein
MPPIPELGPMFWGGQSILDQRMTHDTSGIPNYPAFDDAFVAGTDIIAPEDLRVTASSSSSPGDAFYATGGSKINYWIGHLVTAPAVGKTFKKGVKIGDVMKTDVGGGSHVHVGMDVRPLTGQSLKYGANGDGPDYTYYPFTVEEQLTKMLGGKEEPVQDWVGPWLEWYMQGQYRDPPMKRPADAPSDIPDDIWALQKDVADMLKRQGANSCYQKWRDWYQTPGHSDENRPSCAPGTIYEEWWESRNRDLEWVT